MGTDRFASALTVFSERQGSGIRAVHIPPKARGQIALLLTDITGTLIEGGQRVGAWYHEICMILNRSAGMDIFPEGSGFDPVHSMQDLIREAEPLLALDAIELLFARLDNRPRPAFRKGPSPSTEEAVATLNQILQRNNVDLSFENGRLVRVDSEIVHAEIVHPALVLLMEPMYKYANDDYMNAHRHFRNGDYGSCVVECRKAFVSTMKAICTKRAWPFDPKAAANALIRVVLSNGLLPNFQNQFNGLEAVLQGATFASNRAGGGHGGGDPPAAHVAAFTLHVTAADILLLVRAEQALP